MGLAFTAAHAANILNHGSEPLFYIAIHALVAAVRAAHQHHRKGTFALRQIYVSREKRAIGHGNLVKGARSQRCLVFQKRTCRGRIQDQYQQYKNKRFTS